jgi:hypothetical protein
MQKALRRTSPMTALPDTPLHALRTPGTTKAQIATTLTHKRIRNMQD